MMKWLLLAVVVVAVLWWLGRGRRSDDHRERSSSADGTAADRPPNAPPRRAPGAPEAMVACAHCGVWLPKADALGPLAPPKDLAESLFYCCEAHRRAGPGSV